MSGAYSRTEPKKRSRRFYLVLAATIVLIAVIIGVIIFEVSNINQTIYGPGPVEIEVISDKLVYLQGEEVNFTIYVTNPQNWSVPEPSSVTDKMYMNGSEVFGGKVEISFGPNLPLFPPHSRKLYDTRTWDGKVGPSDNRTLAPPVTYTFIVSFAGIVDYGNSGNCTFEIRPNPSQQSLTVEINFRLLVLYKLRQKLNMTIQRKFQVISQAQMFNL